MKAITRAIHAEMVAAENVQSNTTAHVEQLERHLQYLDSKVAEDKRAVEEEEEKAEMERVRKVG